MAILELWYSSIFLDRAIHLALQQMCLSFFILCVFSSYHLCFPKVNNRALFGQHLSEQQSLKSEWLMNQHFNKYFMKIPRFQLCLKWKSEHCWLQFKIQRVKKCWSTIVCDVFRNSDCSGNL